MRIENTVEVDAPLDRVWALVNDIPRVAPCMPGAALTGVLDDKSYEGTVAVKLGPLRMSYKGKVVVEEVAEANHSARLAGDAGARDLVAAHPDWVHRVEVGDLGSDADVDVEADLARVGRMLTTTTTTSNGRQP